MRKTTIWLSPEGDAALERLSRAQGRSRSDVIREGIRRLSAELPAHSAGLARFAHMTDFSLQGIWARVQNHRSAGTPAVETAQALGLAEEDLPHLIELLERRFFVVN